MLEEAKPRSSTSSARSPIFPVIRYAASFCPSACKLPFTTIAKRAAISSQHLLQLGDRRVQFEWVDIVAPVQGLRNLVEIVADAIELGIVERQQSNVRR